MKKSFNVNLGSRIFQIDEDAYEQLSDYLVLRISRHVLASFSRRAYRQVRHA